MCDSKCWYAMGPSCHCDCGGVNHGGGGFRGFRVRRSSRRPWYRVPREVWLPARPQPPVPHQATPDRHRGALETAKSFLLGVGKNALVAALLVGLTAVHPVLGATAAKAYGMYSHGLAGLALYHTYTEWKSGRESTPHAAGEAAKVVAGEAAAGGSNALAASMVGKLKQAGVIDQMSEQTNVNPVITSDMLRGTISASASQGFGDLAGYTVEEEASTWARKHSTLWQ